MSDTIIILGYPARFKDRLNRIVFAAEQHFDYMKRSISSESGRYTADEHDQLWGDILDMRESLTKIEGTK